MRASIVIQSGETVATLQLIPDTSELSITLEEFDLDGSERKVFVFKPAPNMLSL